MAVSRRKGTAAGRRRSPAHQAHPVRKRYLSDQGYEPPSKRFAWAYVILGVAGGGIFLGSQLSLLSDPPKETFEGTYATVVGFVILAASLSTILGGILKIQGIRYATKVLVCSLFIGLMFCLGDLVLLVAKDLQYGIFGTILMASLFGTLLFGFLFVAALVNRSSERRDEEMAALTEEPVEALPVEEPVEALPDEDVVEELPVEEDETTSQKEVRLPIVPRPRLDTNS